MSSSSAAYSMARWTRAAARAFMKASRQAARRATAASPSDASVAAAGLDRAFFDSSAFSRRSVRSASELVWMMSVPATPSARREARAPPPPVFTQAAAADAGERGCLGRAHRVFGRHGARATPAPPTARDGTRGQRKQGHLPRHERCVQVAVGAGGAGGPEFSAAAAARAGGSDEGRIQGRRAGAQVGQLGQAGGPRGRQAVQVGGQQGA